MIFAGSKHTNLAIIQCSWHVGGVAALPASLHAGSDRAEGHSSVERDLSAKVGVDTHHSRFVVAHYTILRNVLINHEAVPTRFRSTESALAVQCSARSAQCSALPETRAPPPVQTRQGQRECSARSDPAPALVLRRTGQPRLLPRCGVRRGCRPSDAAGPRSKLCAPS